MAEWWENQLPTPTEQPEHWVMYFDGSLKLEGAGAGVLLISSTDEQLKYVLQIFWKVPNNEAEYEALLHGLRLAASLGIKRLLVYGDCSGHQPSEQVTIPPTWPFACWALDMIRPLPTASGGFNRVLVAIDKFTKWIEVKPVTCPKADRVLDFLDELVHRYGLPHRIITDLGSNFNNHQSENSWIDVRYVSVAHPRAN
jgi:hypothetical protein